MPVSALTALRSGPLRGLQAEHGEVDDGLEVTSQQWVVVEEREDRAGIEPQHRHLAIGHQRHRRRGTTEEGAHDEHLALAEGLDGEGVVESIRRDGDAWVWKFDEEVTGQIGLLNYLGSQQLFRPRQQLDPKFREALRKLPGDMLEHDLVQRPLSVLGGKTVREAAADSAISRTAQAILLLLELQADALDWDFDFDRYRSVLGLPAPAPVGADLLKNRPSIGVSCTKWRRIPLSEMTDEQVSGLMRYAAGIHLTSSAVRYAKEIERRA